MVPAFVLRNAKTYLTAAEVAELMGLRGWSSVNALVAQGVFPAASVASKHHRYSPIVIRERRKEGKGVNGYTTAKWRVGDIVDWQCWK